MSWQARRYNSELEQGPATASSAPPQKRSVRRRQKLTKHHVPPTAVCEDKSRQFILMKSEKDHEAYNRVFGNAKNLKKAQQILRAHFHLFGERKSLAEAMEILEKYWWTQPQEPESV
jgi:hypothetical protein